MYIYRNGRGIHVFRITLELVSNFICDTHFIWHSNQLFINILMLIETGHYTLIFTAPTSTIPPPISICRSTKGWGRPSPSLLKETKYMGAVYYATKISYTFELFQHFTTLSDNPGSTSLSVEGLWSSG